jgi:hypothetical protein
MRDTRQCDGDRFGLAERPPILGFPAVAVDQSGAQNPTDRIPMLESFWTAAVLVISNFNIEFCFVLRDSDFLVLNPSLAT